MNKAAVSFFKTKNSDKGRYFPLPDQLRSLEMNTPHGRLKFVVASNLVFTAPPSGGSDKWKSSITIKPPSGQKAAKPFLFNYSAGTGHRQAVIESPLSNLIAANGVPSEPSARDLLRCIGLDLQTALQIPFSDEAAIKHLQDELGYKDGGEALRIVRKLRQCADEMTRVLGGKASLGDFVEWTEELEATPEVEPNRKNNISFKLPVTEMANGGQMDGTINVEFRSAQNVSTMLTITGKAVPADAIEVLITASLREKESGGERWRSGGGGQCADGIRREWASFPEIVELCDLWSRWHLNGMKAGSAAQMEVLAKADVTSYDQAVAILTEANLLEDPALELSLRKPYRYGAAWLFEVVPPEVVERLSELAKIVPTSKPEQAALGVSL